MGELRRHGLAISAGAFYPRLRKMDEAGQLQGAGAERHGFRPNDSCAHGMGCVGTAVSG